MKPTRLVDNSSWSRTQSFQRIIMEKILLYAHELIGMGRRQTADFDHERPIQSQLGGWIIVCFGRISAARLPGLVIVAFSNLNQTRFGNDLFD